MTTSTTSFGLMTADGKVVHFDQASNAKVQEMMKSNQDWSNAINQHKPVQVQVIASPDGDVMVIKEIK